jgi:hypothetical protein
MMTLTARKQNWQRRRKTTMQTLALCRGVPHALPRPMGLRNTGCCRSVSTHRPKPPGLSAAALTGGLQPVTRREAGEERQAPPLVLPRPSRCLPALGPPVLRLCGQQAARSGAMSLSGNPCHESTGRQQMQGSGHRASPPCVAPARSREDRHVPEPARQQTRGSGRRAVALSLLSDSPARPCPVAVKSWIDTARGTL